MGWQESVSTLSESIGVVGKIGYAFGTVGRGFWDAIKWVGTLPGAWFQAGAYNSYSHAAEQQAQGADAIQTTQTTRTMIALGQDPANSPEGHAAAAKGAAAAGGWSLSNLLPWKWFGGGEQTAEAQPPLRTFTPVQVSSAGGSSGNFTPMQQTAQAPAVDPAAQQAAQEQAQAAVDPVARQQVASLSSDEAARARDARMLGNKAYTEKWGSAPQRG